MTPAGAPIRGTSLGQHIHDFKQSLCRISLEPEKLNVLLLFHPFSTPLRRVRRSGGSGFAHVVYVFSEIGVNYVYSRVPKAGLPAVALAPQRVTLGQTRPSAPSK